MTAQQMLLTDKAVARLPLAADARYKARDTELGGFFVHVGKRSKTFMAEGEYWRDGVRELRVQVKLGEFGAIPAWATPISAAGSASLPRSTIRSGASSTCSCC